MPDPDEVARNVTHTHHIVSKHVNMKTMLLKWSSNFRLAAGRRKSKESGYSL